MKDQTTIDMENQITENKKHIEQLRADLKSAVKEGKKLERDLRTHRLCNVGGLLETYLKEPELLDVDDLKRILDGIISDAKVQLALNRLLKEKMTNSKAAETEIEDDPNEDGDQ